MAPGADVHTTRSPVALPGRAPIARPADRPCRLVDWKPFESGALIGKASVAFPGGCIVSSIPIFRRQDGTLLAGGPDAPLADQTGTQLRDADGKHCYTKIIAFEDRTARDR
jgi:hypothetical protein